MLSDEYDRIQRALGAMSVPEPRPGFFDRAIANATRQPARVAARVDGRARVHPRLTGWGVAAGALAAALAIVLVLPRTATERGPAGIALALDEVREVSVVIDADRDLADATIRLYVSGAIEIHGFAGQRELTWTTSLEHGPNLLSLPILATGAGAARLVAIVEHDGRSKQAVVDLRVDAPPPAKRGGSA